MIFSETLPVILQHEGGYANHPDDPGGATNFGIVQRTYDAYRRSQRLQPRSVKQITKEEVSTIYEKNYWREGKCHLLPVGVNLIHFDFCVNAGVGQAKKTLQRVLGVEPDGVIGPLTLRAAIEKEPKMIVAEYSNARRRFYEGLAAKRPTLKKFLRSWLHRTADCERRAYRAIDAHLGPSKVRVVGPVLGDT